MLRPQLRYLYNVIHLGNNFFGYPENLVSKDKGIGFIGRSLVFSSVYNLIFNGHNLSRTVCRDFWNLAISLYNHPSV
jgi:hypothetical protein